jgi:hypothetical protein
MQDKCDGVPSQDHQALCLVIALRGSLWFNSGEEELTWRT